MALTPPGGALSIVALDRKTGEMGAAVLSQSFSAGSRTIWTESGVGVVVAQGTVEPTYGPLGLALLKGGKTPAQALKSLLATDPRPGVRQVMMMDSRGRAAAHTGSACLPESGYLTGRGFCVQANFAASKRAWRSMAAAYRGTKGSLVERMVSALEASEQSTRGARRGVVWSAAVVVVAALPTNAPWEGRLLDLRVESSQAPLKELKAMLRVQEAYGHAASGEELLGRGDLAKGGREFSAAISLSPESTELKLWFALGLLRSGQTKSGEAMLRSAVGRGGDAKELLRELTARGIIGAPARRPKAEA